MPSLLVEKRPLRNGRIVGSLVLSVILFVLIPTWLLGNLFVAVFPPPSTSTNTSSSSSLKQNKTLPQNQTTQRPSPGPNSLQVNSTASTNEENDPPVRDEASSVTPEVTTPSTTSVVSAASVAVEPVAVEPQFRLWTNSAGKTVEAKFVRYVGDKIELTTIAGKPAFVSPSIFSAADQEYLKQFQAKQ